eukprot:TRINITY_DN346_c0_g1_i2.p1 TRINITY_DN346_c0_g1~~TRINITY_DN346_c0_g1_i2.p1  ORF type:complete len:199 (+),score=49.88 TRINITY_DN346_c0_g1_i2:525-1121(+)
MDSALRKDTECLKRGVAAVNRMKLTPFLEKELRTNPLQEVFVKAGGIDMLAAWLQRLPDGSLPSKPMVQSLLGILTSFDLWDELHSSGVSRALLEIKGTAGRDAAFAKQIQTLLDKWNRISFDPENRRQKKRIRPEEELRRFPANASKRCYVPERSLLDFSRAPESKVSHENRADDLQFRKCLRKAKLNMSRTMSKKR